MPDIIGDLDELTGLVRRSARQEALDVAADAQRRAQQARERAAAQAQQVRDQLLAAAQGEVAQAGQRRLAQVALETQQRRLVVREALLDQVWADAEQRLREQVSHPSYADVLRRLAMAAAATLGQGPVVLAADPAGHGLLTAERLAAWSTEAQLQFVAAPQPAPIWGGLLAHDEGGRRLVDASFATRLALARADLREQVAQRLGVVG